VADKSEISNPKSAINNIPVIILAGGLGTRLRLIINDIPKPMAPVNGKPFLHYILKSLQGQNVSSVILSVAYKCEMIKEFFKDEYLGIRVQYSIEEEPLGTGGGIKKAFNLVKDFAFVLNGDTFFDVPLNELRDFYFSTGSDLVLALKLVKGQDRYGTVQIDEANRIKRFEEKRFMKEALINGGTYFLNKSLWNKISVEEKFSFEKDVLEKYTDELKFNGKVFENYFIDIGIPEDYERAQHDLK